jgi:hypothetical protein
MLLKQQFKTLNGALKRAAFEHAHLNGYYECRAVRCLDGEPDPNDMDASIPRTRYTWRIKKSPRRV